MSYVYILTSDSNSTVYVGVTNNLERRLGEHRENINDSFTSRYKLYKLVYFEEFNDIKDAIEREKQIKSWSRKRKNELIENFNPLWENIEIF